MPNEIATFESCEDCEIEFEEPQEESLCEKCKLRREANQLKVENNYLRLSKDSTIRFIESLKATYELSQERPPVNDFEDGIHHGYKIVLEDIAKRGLLI